MRNAIAIALAVVLAGCSLVRPGGPTIATFNAEVCSFGALDGVPQPPVPCFTLPNVQLPDDAAEFVGFAGGLAAFYVGPLVGDVGDCVAEGATVPGELGTVTATATLTCPTKAGGVLTQSVAVTLTRHP